jgi:hypothetical protein
MPLPLQQHQRQPHLSLLLLPPSTPGQALIKRLAATPPSSQAPRVTVDAGGFCFHYLLEAGVVFLTLTDKVGGGWGGGVRVLL